MRNLRAHHRDAGFVLANVLVIVAVLSAVAVAILAQTQKSLDRAELVRDAAQADLVADAALLLAERLLAEDARASDVDHRREAWALDGYRTDIAGGEATISVRDLQARFNLNLLKAATDDIPIEAFRRVALAAGLGAEATSALAGMTGDARAPVGTDLEGRGDGAQYLPDDFLSASEVELILGLDAGALAEAFVALPRDRRVNVNTAEAETLSALLGRTITGGEGGMPVFDSVAAFTAATGGGSGPAADSGEPDLLTTSSTWFEAEVVARFGGIERHRITVLYRNPETGAVRRTANRPAAD